MSRVQSPSPTPKLPNSSLQATSGRVSLKGQLQPAVFLLYFITLEYAIRSQQHHSFRARLCNQHAVERIAMMPWQAPRLNSVKLVYIQRPHSHFALDLGDKALRLHVEWKSSDCVLNSDFPY